MMSNVENLEKISRTLRARIVELSHLKKMPHLGSCLSCVDILTALYFHALDIDSNDPARADRDRFILSKGHGAPALYQTLALKGFFPHQDLIDDDHGAGGRFGEHPPSPSHLPGIEAATGSLGHGLPIGLGMALSGRLNQSKFKTVVLLGDGECNEGSIWEAAMFASAQKLQNLAVVVDFNKWQATGRSREILALAPLADKWRAFGWSTREVDGHDMEELIRVFDNLPDGSERPVAIIAHTVKGKGVSFMEDDNNWHYRIPTAEEVTAARRELGVGE